MALTMKVNLEKRKKIMLEVTKSDIFSEPNSIILGEALVAAIENARKAEARAVKRLCVWVAAKHPAEYKRLGLQEFMETK